MFLLHLIPTYFSACLLINKKNNHKILYSRTGIITNQKQITTSFALKLAADTNLTLTIETHDEDA